MSTRARVKYKRNNPQPYPYFEAGDFLILSIASGHRALARALPQKKGKVREAEFLENSFFNYSFGFKRAKVGPNCSWTIEVIGREDEPGI